MNDIVLLNLRISMWGVNRVLPENEYEVDADRAMESAMVIQDSLVDDAPTRQIVLRE